MLQVDFVQQLAHRFSAHAGIEIVAELFQCFEILLVVEQLSFLERGHARIDDDVAFEIKHALDVTQGHVQQQADTARQRLQEPDVCNGRSQLNVGHTLTAHLGQRNFNAALLTDNAAMLEALVLTAQALIVLDRAKDLGAEQAVALGLERTIVDGLWLLDFTKGPGTDHLGRSQCNLDGIELFDLTLVFQQIQQVFQGLSSSRTCDGRLMPDAA